MVNNGGTDPVTIRISINFDTTTVQKKLAVFFTISNQALNFLEVCFAVKRRNVKVFCAGSNLEFLCFFDKVRNPLLSITNE